MEIGGLLLNRYPGGVGWAVRVALDLRTYYMEELGYFSEEELDDGGFYSASSFVSTCVFFS